MYFLNTHFTDRLTYDENPFKQFSSSEVKTKQRDKKGKWFNPTARVIPAFTHHGCQGAPTSAGPSLTNYQLCSFVTINRLAIRA